MVRPPVCKLPKRKATDFIILGVSILASIITVSGTFGLLTTTLVSTPTATMTNQNIFTMFLGVIIFILVVMLWRTKR